MSEKSIDLKGRKELEEQLAALAGRAHKNAVVAGVRAGAAVVRKAARANLINNKDTGRLSRSITTQAKAYDDHVIARVGPSTDGFYGSMMEYGTSRQAPEPFLANALQDNEDSVVDAIYDKIQSHIDKTIAKSKA